MKIPNSNPFQCFLAMTQGVDAGVLAMKKAIEDGARAAAQNLEETRQKWLLGMATLKGMLDEIGRVVEKGWVIQELQDRIQGEHWRIPPEIFDIITDLERPAREWLDALNAAGKLLAQELAEKDDPGC